MSSVNKVILIGNLGRDPELRYTGSGQAVCQFSIATSESWGQGDDRQERTEWHRIVVWGRRGEVAAEYMKKGSKVYIEGRLQTRKWQDKNGQDRYTTEVVARDFQFLDRREGGGGGRSSSNEPPLPEDPFGGNQLDDDDIPF